MLKQSECCFRRRLLGVLGKQLKAIFLGRKQRRKGPNGGKEPPPHSRKQAPSLWACAVVEEGHSPAHQAAGRYSTVAAQSRLTLPHCLTTTPRVNEKQMAGCISVCTSDAGPPRSSRPGNLLFISQAEKSQRGRREADHHFQGVEGVEVRIQFSPALKSSPKPQVDCGAHTKLKLSFHYPSLKLRLGPREPEGKEVSPGLLMFVLCRDTNKEPGGGQEQ